MKTLRIALLVPAPFDTISGGYLYDRRLVEGLRALGHAVRVDELAGRFPMPDATAEAAVEAAWARLAPDEVPLIDSLALPAFRPLARVLAARNAVALIHHPTSLEPGPYQAELAAIERVVFAACGRLVATSRATAKGLPPLGAEASRIGVVEPGTDPAPRAAGSGGPGARILSVGSLIPRKGHDVLLRALGRLTDLDWTLRIAGPAADPVHADGLRALAEELGLASRVSFLGPITDGALEAEYAAADLFALATWFEGFGMAAAEAQIRGLPLILCTGGAITDVVGPGAAILAAPGDANSLSRGMRRPIMDTALRAEMAEASWRAGQALPRWEDRAARFVAEMEAAGHGQ
ncbi:glycosyltransferase family 4 protein [Sediminicoccus sp. KRV36]|uniref:glycosyltransferase family 4 protein n=1 Tax=Sediminicoccus sp. KRV36 TaxID=3133721 RepID=UPI002010C3F5|nr:glycosyltransferase family 4 protein [Sediminicoccus rosea]UPY35363.1 glycosyltransferase family 4 protein [Sediminicoccus rosea]